MLRERVTAQDVAKLAGVSQSAVSRVFTPGASASAKTAEKVRRAAAQLGYRPNVLARAMVSGKSRIIGLVVAYLENQFYPLALERLSNRLQEKGYHLLVFMVSNAAEEVDGAVEDMLDYQVEGIIAASASINSALTERCMQAGIPVVMFNRSQDGAAFSAVTSNNLAGGREVARFLVEGGHERIAHIAGWQGSSTGRDRALGFRAGLEAAHVGLLAEVDGMYSRDVATEAARRLMDRPDPPDAIFVGNDHMAFAVMDVLRWDLGIDVPGDVSIVGYDDVPLAAWGAYRLTSVRQPLQRMVEATVEALLDRIEAPNRDAQHIEIEGSLVVRQSARIPEGWTE